MRRVILHYDMDCFYASIEMRDNRKYAGKPLVVAGGVVTTANYVARKYGIRSAMSTSEAKRRCPRLIVVPVNKDKYRRESENIQNLILKITDKVEFIALDEGFLDITEIIKRFSSKESFAHLFRKRIFECTGLTCSVGIGPNKLIAKIASDINKPGGQHIFHSEKEFQSYIMEKDIGILPGVGKELKKLLNKRNIVKVKDILNYPLKTLVGRYGNSRGELLYSYSRGIDFREVEFNKITHSISNENSYRIALNSILEIERELNLIFDKGYKKVLESNYLVKTISVKIKLKNGEMFTKSKTRAIFTNDKTALKEMLEEILNGFLIESEV